MERNTNATLAGKSFPIRLTPNQVNDLLSRKYGGEFGARAKYARRIRRHRSTVTRLINGELGGELRCRFADFLGVSEEMLPQPKVRRRRRELGAVA